MQDYYDLLGLNENCTKDEAKNAFMSKKKEVQGKMLSRNPEERALAVKELGELTSAYKAVVANITDTNAANANVINFSSTNASGKSDDEGTVISRRTGIKTLNEKITKPNPPVEVKRDNNVMTLQANKNMMIIFGMILGILMLGIAVYFVFFKPDTPKGLPITNPPIANPTPAKSIIPRMEEAQDSYNERIASIAALINNALEKKGTLKDEFEILNKAVRVEDEIADCLTELRNSSDTDVKTRKGVLITRMLEAERRRVRGLADGLRAAIGGRDYQPGFEEGRAGYYEYEYLRKEYKNLKTGDFKPQMAYVNGDDVFLRSAPSTNSSVIKTLKRNSGLDAIAVQTCDDERAGMINTDNVVVGFNGQNIRLAKGQPLTITGENGGTYQCQLNLENGSGTIYVDKVNVKKLYGETWYKVRLSGGTEGWVYKDFIQLKRAL